MVSLHYRQSYVSRGPSLKYIKEHQPVEEPFDPTYFELAVSFQTSWLILPYLYHILYQIIVTTLDVNRIAICVANPYLAVLQESQAPGISHFGWHYRQLS